MNRTLTVQSIAPYGRQEPLYRPKCKNSEAFTELLGSKTLTETQLRIIRDRLGYIVEESSPPPSLNERLNGTVSRAISFARREEA